MNTKKFVKKVNDLISFQCRYIDSHQFSIELASQRGPLAIYDVKQKEAIWDSGFVATMYSMRYTLSPDDLVGLMLVNDLESLDALDHLYHDCKKRWQAPQRNWFTEVV